MPLRADLTDVSGIGVKVPDMGRARASTIASHASYEGKPYKFETDSIVKILYNVGLGNFATAFWDYRSLVFRHPIIALSTREHAQVGLGQSHGDYKSMHAPWC